MPKNNRYSNAPWRHSKEGRIRANADVIARAPEYLEAIQRFVAEVERIERKRRKA